MGKKCAVPSPPKRDPAVWAQLGNNNKWHPVDPVGDRCLCGHGGRLAPGQPRRWAVTTPGHRRCSFTGWPGPASGVDPVPEPAPPGPVAGGVVRVRDAWLSLLSVQGHRCAVCGGRPTVIDVAPDGLVRGLLCRLCRMIAVSCRHTPHCAADYLSRPPAKPFSWRLARPIRQGAS